LKEYYFEGITVRCWADTAAGNKPLQEHAKPTTTLTVYTHLFADDHSDAMAARSGRWLHRTPRREATSCDYGVRPLDWCSDPVDIDLFGQALEAL
jgi:hypothetical protein